MPNRQKDSSQEGWKRWIEFINRWQNKYPSFTKYKKDRYRFYFTYLDYDYTIRSMIYSTNWIERLNKAFRRVTNMRASMPKVESVISLFIGVAMSMKTYNYKIYIFEYETKKFNNSK